MKPSIIEHPLLLGLTDEDVQTLTEALEELRRVKMTALATVNAELHSNSRVRPFTKEDFGIDDIDALIARLGDLA